MRLPSRSPARLAVVMGVVCALAQIWASWPGWLAGDSLKMLLEARREGPIRDWHSPLLIWSWQFLGDVRWGPVIPMLIQMACTWGGLTLLSQRFIRLGWRWAWAMLPAAFLLGAAWTPSWVLKDSFVAALLVLALGVASLGDLARSRWASVAVWVVPSLLIAAACIPRWFLAPILAVAVWALARLAGRTGGRQIAASLGVFAVTVLVLVGFERAIVKPVPDYVIGSTMFLDLARVECVVGTPEQRAAGESILPSQFVRAGDPGRDICEDFNPLTHDTMFRFAEAAPKDSPYYVLPVNDQQMAELTDAWLAVWQEYPGILIGNRVMLAGTLLGVNSNVWWSPSAYVMSDWSVSQPGGMGEGENADPPEPSRGGLLLVILAVVTWIGSQMLAALPFGVMTVLVLPGFAAYRLRRRTPQLLGLFGPALLFPVVYVLAFSAVAPSYDFRYANPAAIWGLLVSLWALAAGRARTPATGATDGTAPLATVDSSETT